MKKILMVFTIILASCKEKHAIDRLPDSEFDLIMTVYHRAWIDGANAATDACNNNIPFGQYLGSEKLRKDSLSFIGELYRIK